MMLNHPTPRCHLPACVEVRHRSQASQERIDHGEAAENPEDTPLERAIFSRYRACRGQIHSLEYSESNLRRGMCTLVLAAADVRRTPTAMRIVLLW
jgi:hypothetical protein